MSVRNYPNSPLAEADSAIWSPGQSGWDFITPLIQQAGLRLFAEEIRRWRIISSSDYIPGTLSEGTNLAAAQDSVSRNDEDSFDAVIVAASMIFRPAATATMMQFVGTLLGIASTAAVTFHILGEQNEKLNNVEQQTNGINSKPKEEDAELHAKNSELKAKHAELSAKLPVE